MTSIAIDLGTQVDFAPQFGDGEEHHTVGETYGFIPLGFWLTRHHPELKGAQRVVYMALGQFINAGNCRPTKRELRFATGLSENTIDTSLKALRADGFVLVGLSDRAANTYTLLRGPWNDPPPAAGAPSPPRQLGPLKSLRKTGEKKKEKAADPAATGLQAPPRARVEMHAAASQKSHQRRDKECQQRRHNLSEEAKPELGHARPSPAAPPQPGGCPASPPVGKRLDTPVSSRDDRRASGARPDLPHAGTSRVPEAPSSPPKVAPPRQTADDGPGAALGPRTTSQADRFPRVERAPSAGRPPAAVVDFLGSVGLTIPDDVVLRPLAPERPPAPPRAAPPAPGVLERIALKHGPQAAAEAREVLAEPSARAHPKAAETALYRLLDVDVGGFQTNAKAALRFFVKRAIAGDLGLAKSAPKPPKPLPVPIAREMPERKPREDVGGGARAIAQRYLDLYLPPEDVPHG